MADAAIHIVGVAGGVAATVALMWFASFQNSPRVYVACALYGTGLLAMLGLSAAYHLVQRHPLKYVLRRLDHAAIFVMIAGSYTPFALVKLEHPWGTSLLVVVWVITLLGVAMKLAFPHRIERLSVGLYLAQGWIILLAFEKLVDAVSLSSLILLVIGGFLYTIGVIFHLSEQLRFHNAIWHGFVLAAATCHFAVIMDEVALAIPAL